MTPPCITDRVTTAACSIRALVAVVAIVTGCSSDFEFQVAVSYDGVDAVTLDGSPADDPTVITTTFARYSEACGVAYAFDVTYQTATTTVSISPCSCGGGPGPVSSTPFNDVTSEDDGYRIYVKDGAIAVWGEGGCSNGATRCSWRTGEIDDDCGALGSDQ